MRTATVKLADGTVIAMGIRDNGDPNTKVFKLSAILPDLIKRNVILRYVAEVPPTPAIIATALVITPVQADAGPFQTALTEALAG